MVEQYTPPIDDVFHALSDGTRRSMLRRLAARDCTVGELAAPHPMSLAAASKHIKVLEKAGLIRREIEGRTHWCRLQAAPLAAAHSELGFYEQFWTGRLDTLDRLLREDDARKARDTEPTKPQAPEGDRQ